MLALFIFFEGLASLSLCLGFSLVFISLKIVFLYLNSFSFDPLHIRYFQAFAFI